MRLIAMLLIVQLTLGGVLSAQAGPDLWRDFAQKVDVGSELKVRLADGTAFRATLVSADDAVLLLQPKTRVPVPVQTVPYDAIASLAVPPPGGISAGKAIAIGAGVGAAAFWGMFAVALAIFSD